MLPKRFLWTILIAACCAALMRTATMTAQQPAPTLTVEGVLSILHVDPLDGPHFDVPRLHTNPQTASGLVYELDIPVATARTFREQTVRVTGQLVSAPDERGSAQLRVATLDVLSGSTQRDAQAITGTWPYLTILCAFAEYEDLLAPAFYQGLLYNDANPTHGMVQYFRDMSYGQLSLHGSTTHPTVYTMPLPWSSYAYSGFDGLDRAAADCAQQADPLVNFDLYAGVNLMFNEAVLSNGAAYGGGSYYFVEGQARYMATTWMPPWAQNPNVLGHEIGHTLGLPHSGGRPGYGQYPYNSYWDIMSRGHASFALGCFDQSLDCQPTGLLGYNVARDPAGLSGAFPDSLGWVADAPTVLARTRRQLTLAPLRQQSASNPQFVWIEKGDSGTYYGLELRDQAFAADSVVPATGVLVSEIDFRRQDPALVVDLDGDDEVNEANNVLTLNDTFRDAQYNITVEVVAVGADGYTLEIRNDIQPPTFSTGRTEAERLQDGAFAVWYSGDWQSVGAVEASGGSLRRGSVGAGALFNASGDQLALLYTQRPAGGTLRVCVEPTNGSLTCRTIDTAGAQTAYQQVALFDLIASSEVTLDVLSGTVDFDAVEIGSPPSMVSGLTAQATSRTAMAVNWNPSPSGPTRILRDGEQIALSSAGSLTDGDLTCGTTFTYAATRSNLFGTTPAANATASTTACPVALAVGVAEEDNPRMVVSESWLPYEFAPGQVGIYTSLPGALVQFSFTGNRLILHHAESGGFGSLEVCIDDVCQMVEMDNGQNSIDFYAQSTLTTPQIDTHEVVIRNRGGLVFLDKVTVESTGPLTAGRYEETAANLDFDGLWVDLPDGDASGGSIKYTFDPDAALRFSYTGGAVAVRLGAFPLATRARLCITGLGCIEADVNDDELRFDVPLVYPQSRPEGNSSRAATLDSPDGQLLIVDFVRIGTVPAAPKLEADATQPYTVALSWQPDDAADEFVLARDGQPIATLDATTSDYTDSSAACGQTVSYSLTASNDFGLSQQATQSVTVSCPAIIENEVIEEDDPRLIYQGDWFPYTDPGTGTRVRFSAAAGNEVRFRVQGERFEWVAPMALGFGALEVCIGDSCETVSTATDSPEIEWEGLLRFEDLGEGLHEVRIRTLDAGIVALDRLSALPPLILTAGLTENDDPGLTYSGEWFLLPFEVSSGGHFAYTFSDDAQLRFRFEGTGFTLRLIEHPLAGQMRVCVDDGLCQIVDLRGDVPFFQAERRFIGYVPGVHTVEITPVAGSGALTFDGVEVE